MGAPKRNLTILIKIVLTADGNQLYKV